MLVAAYREGSNLSGVQYRQAEPIKCQSSCLNNMAVWILITMDANLRTGQRKTFFAKNAKS